VGGKSYSHGGGYSRVVALTRVVFVCLRMKINIPANINGGTTKR